MSPTPKGQLPVTFDIKPDEDLAGYAARVAEANFMTLPDLTGHRRDARIWEAPPPQLLTRISLAAGVPVERARTGTLRAAFPGVVIERARTGRRYAGQPARCPQCGLDSVAARLNLVVLCPACRTLLVDHSEPAPAPPPIAVAGVHHQVMMTLAAARRSKLARARLGRLESLMAELEPALWTNWPSLLEGESVTWRERVVSWEAAATASQVIYARPPWVSATLLALTWDVSGDPAATLTFLDHCASMADIWANTTDLPAWASRAEAVNATLSLLPRLGIEACHVPSILRHPGDAIVLPEYLRTARTADALALTVLAARAHRETLSVGQAEQFHGAHVSSRVRRLARTTLATARGVARVAAHARILHDQGLIDRAAARAELRTLDHVPAALTSQLHPPARDDPDVRRLAAAWIWLDATGGRLAGGPHVLLAPSRILDFDQTLDPENKLVMRTWWQQHLTLTGDLIDQATSVPTEGKARRDVG